jgi:hypothetical protein
VYEVELVVAAVRGVSAVVPLRNGVIVIAERALPPFAPLVQVTVNSFAELDAVAVPIVGACGKCCWCYCCCVCSINRCSKIILSISINSI